MVGGKGKRCNHHKAKAPSIYSCAGSRRVGGGIFITHIYGSPAVGVPR